MVSSLQLRDYQNAMLDRLRDAWSRHRSVMVQMPTGTGKTVLLAEVIRKELRGENTGLGRVASRERGKAPCVLVVAHRIELIEQISQTLDSFGVRHSQIVSGRETDWTSAVQVASIQTLTRRTLLLPSPEGEGYFTPSLVIVDEAHHALAKTYKILWAWWPEAKFLGLTATPCRLSGEPLADLFDQLLQSWSIRDFILKGWLSDLDYVSVRSDSRAVQQIAQLNKRGADGDFQTKQMATVLDVPESIEHLFLSYKKYADGKKGIVYAINRQHAQHIAAYYLEHGVRCAVIDSMTLAACRQRTLQDYRQQALDVLVNVDIFSEGFDCPEVEFIQLARPTMSLSKFLQQVGRGMRVTTSKKEVIILDQVGSYLIFGLPTSDRNWQATFSGKAQGKGALHINKGASYRGGETEKDLINEQMIRIKSVIGGDRQAIADDGNSPSGQGKSIGTNTASRLLADQKEEESGKLAANVVNASRSHKRILVQVPPHINKAVLLRDVIQQSAASLPQVSDISDFRVLVIVSTHDHIDIVSKMLREVGIRSSEFRGDAHVRLRKNRFLLCCDDSIAGSLTDLATCYSPDAIVFWNVVTCHQQHFPLLFKYWPQANVVGFTIAPCDIRDFGSNRSFETLVESGSTAYYIEHNRLKRVEYAPDPYGGITEIFMRSMPPKENPDNYVTEELLALLCNQENTAHIYKSYKAFADGRRGIIYAKGVRHARCIKDYFIRNGVRAAVLAYGFESSKSREISLFFKGETTVLISPNIYDSDYPFPELEFVQLTYPCQLLSVYLALVGSGLKVSQDFPIDSRTNDSDNKLVVIDNTLMGEMFGHPADSRDWHSLFEQRRYIEQQNKKDTKTIAREDTAVTATNKWELRRQRLLGEDKKNQNSDNNE